MGHFLSRELRELGPQICRSCRLADCDENDLGCQLVKITRPRAYARNVEKSVWNTRQSIRQIITRLDPRRRILPTFIEFSD